MSKALVEGVQKLFRPQQARWACEFTSRHIIVGGVDAKRRRVEGRAIAELPEGVLTASLSEVNIPNPGPLRTMVRDTLRAASFKGSEIVVVIPDEASRVSFVMSDTLPKTAEEQQTFLRWKLKKSVPFEVDTAQIAFRVVSVSRERKENAYEILVALSPRNIIEEYEQLLEELDIHAGFVTPSTLAALNLISIPKEDLLFVKLSPDCVTTTIFQQGQIRFYRRVTDANVFDSVYPTVLYYQDKLGGSALREIVVCGYGSDIAATAAELQQKIGTPAVLMEPRNIDDVYKPVLGAVNLSWTDLV